MDRTKVKRFVLTCVLAACKVFFDDGSVRFTSGAEMSEMVSRMCCVDFQNLLAWQSAESRVRSEAAGVIKQTSNTGCKCFHFDCIFEVVRWLED